VRGSVLPRLSALQLQVKESLDAGVVAQIDTLGFLTPPHALARCPPHPPSLVSGSSLACMLYFAVRVVFLERLGIESSASSRGGAVFAADLSL